MEPIYQTNFEITERDVDCFGRLLPARILSYAQEVAGMHSTELTVGYDVLARQRMFWAVTRHKVQVARLPRLGETIHVETWPMPPTRVAFPRSMVAYDEAGREVFRSISLWVLMDLDTRNMILPGKSGITLSGTVRGNELAVPMGLPAKLLKNTRSRQVCFTDLDRNGHMNNCRYLDWICDLIPSGYHKGHEIREFTVCYLSEAREGQQLELRWDYPEEGCLYMDAHRQDGSENTRVFSARLLFE